VKAEDLRTLDGDELTGRLKTSRRELYELRFKLAVGQLDDHRQIRKVRKDIARILTVVHARRLGEEVMEAPVEVGFEAAAGAAPTAVADAAPEAQAAVEDAAEAGTEAAAEVAGEATNEETPEDVETPAGTEPAPAQSSRKTSRGTRARQESEGE
jgi:large subunit ribosomal protein L29